MALSGDSRGSPGSNGSGRGSSESHQHSETLPHIPSIASPIAVRHASAPPGPPLRAPSLPLSHHSILLRLAKKIWDGDVNLLLKPVCPS